MYIIFVGQIFVDFVVLKKIHEDKGIYMNICKIMKNLTHENFALYSSKQVKLAVSLVPRLSELPNIYTNIITSQG